MYVYIPVHVQRHIYYINSHIPLPAMLSIATVPCGSAANGELTLPPSAADSSARSSLRSTAGTLPVLWVFHAVEPPAPSLVAHMKLLSFCFQWNKTELQR